MARTGVDPVFLDTNILVHANVAESPRHGVALETVELGPLGAEEVEVSVEYCGLCHSDLSILNNDWGISQYPAILGHGRGEQFGGGANRLRLRLRDGAQGGDGR